eukprot:1177642-Prorocentrum_minimum.AAC.2
MGVRPEVLADLASRVVAMWRHAGPAREEDCVHDSPDVGDPPPRERPGRSQQQAGGGGPQP